MREVVDGVFEVSFGFVNMRLVVTDVAKLASFDFEHAVFGHGRAVSGRAVERFRAYAAQRH